MGFLPKWRISAPDSSPTVSRKHRVIHSASCRKQSWYGDASWQGETPKCWHISGWTPARCIRVDIPSDRAGPEWRTRWGWEWIPGYRIGCSKWSWRCQNCFSIYWRWMFCCLFLKCEAAGSRSLKCGWWEWAGWPLRRQHMRDSGHFALLCGRLSHPGLWEPSGWNALLCFVLLQRWNSEQRCRWLSLISPRWKDWSGSVSPVRFVVPRPYWPLWRTKLQGRLPAGNEAYWAPPSAVFASARISRNSRSSARCCGRNLAVSNGWAIRVWWRIPAHCPLCPFADAGRKMRFRWNWCGFEGLLLAPHSQFQREQLLYYLDSIEV